VPGHLSCKVCELELDGEDEIAAAGITGVISIADANPGDFYDEPEWDEYR
jgi:hypothetical protein